MSYKTWINGKQILGNNEYSRELIDELIKQGMSDPKDDDWCYEFEVKDISAVINAIDEHVKKGVKKRVQLASKMYDFSDYIELLDEEPLYVSMESLVDYSYIFGSYNVVQYLLHTGCIEKTSDDKVFVAKKPIVISAG
jgi:hypothetical protein